MQQDKALDDIFDILGRHYNPVPSTVVWCFHFNSQTRHYGESVSDFVATLKSLSEHCSYDKQLDNMIRDRLVFGVNATIPKRLPELH